MSLPGVTGVVLIILSYSDLIDVGVITHSIVAAQVALVLVSVQAALRPRVGHVTEGIGPAGRVACSEL